jgi:nucleotide-binding universal stress UspA family protein
MHGKFRLGNSETSRRLGRAEQKWRRVARRTDAALIALRAQGLDVGSAPFVLTAFLSRSTATIAICVSSVPVSIYSQSRQSARIWL